MRLLQMDFQPLFMAGLCLRKVDRSLWSTVQKDVVPLKRPTCSICGFVAETKRSLIHADEVWSFPEPPKVVLADIRALCVNCHDGKDYSDFLRRVAQGIASPSRSFTIIDHYCSVNNCSPSDFDADFQLERQRKNALETAYKWNFHKNVVVDYGKWDRPLDKPRLTDVEKKLVRSLYRDRDEPIEVQGASLSNFGLAVRYLQGLHLVDRTATIQEMQNFVLNDYEDDDALTEADEGVQFVR